MDFFRFMFTRRFLKHFLASVGIFAIILWIAFMILSGYTRHGKTIEVPDFKGKDFEQVSNDPAYSDFEFVVIDSVFNLKLPKGGIVRQDPYPGSEVKANRKIYLTIVSANPEKTTMPDLKFMTLRQAISILESIGLLVGKISYIPSFDADAVQQQSTGGKIIEAGTKLDKGSVIDLTVGMGSQGQAPEGEFIPDSTFSDSLESIDN